MRFGLEEIPSDFHIYIKSQVFYSMLQKIEEERNCLANSFTAHRENLYLNLVTSHVSRDADSKSEDDVEPRYSDLVSRALSIIPFCQKPGT